MSSSPNVDCGVAGVAGVAGSRPEKSSQYFAGDPGSGTPPAPFACDAVRPGGELEPLAAFAAAVLAALEARPLPTSPLSHALDEIARDAEAAEAAAYKAGPYYSITLFTA